MPNEIELTDEMIADAKRCGYHCDCTECGLFKIRSGDAVNCISTLAAALEAERAKGTGVWDGAPTGATEKTVTWTRGNFIERLGGDVYTRSLPKSPARLRAESIIGDQLEGEERDKAIKALEGVLG